MKSITTPISDEAIRDLKVGDSVALSGMMVTGRDAAHKWMMETFIKKTRAPQGDDLQVYEELKKLLHGSVIYHCVWIQKSINFWQPDPPLPSVKSRIKQML